MTTPSYDNAVTRNLAEVPDCQGQSHEVKISPLRNEPRKYFRIIMTLRICAPKARFRTHSPPHTHRRNTRLRMPSSTHALPFRVFPQLVNSVRINSIRPLTFLQARVHDPDDVYGAAQAVHRRRDQWRRLLGRVHRVHFAQSVITPAFKRGHHTEHLVLNAPRDRGPGSLSRAP
jgi:hypothetical protein